MTKATCPASCGELIQGWIEGGEKLVSCPIDWFSTAEVTDDNSQTNNAHHMAQKAFTITLDFLQQPTDAADNLTLHISSNIPKAKGMASSTADVAATIMATARYFGQELNQTDLAHLCTRLEPTDGTIFDTLTLFDHNNGEIIESLGTIDSMNVLVLESSINLETADYHRMKRFEKLQSSANQLDKAHRLLKNAIDEQDKALLGEAATLSAIESQKILPKPLFYSLLDIVERQGLYGVNLAHSGSVIGLLYDEHRHDIEKVVAQIKNLDILGFYHSMHYQHLITGGVR
ncbi:MULTISPECIES: GHMP family kinase ATP-binding protein [Vibrio]|uniref:GHMP kinase n=2 Tax=Vibrio TaxID=662 RepID=A0A7X4LJW8_9VIBR|nr:MULTISPECIES: GHMP kinase [Vibrio]MBF9002584.1 GHMP kinase [Vibrio nitrifigilis]MZI93348.1 GHMP kinase [Vibrio eleionomae]